MVGPAQLRHAAHRVRQTRSAFRNPYSVLGATAAGVLRRGGEVRFRVDDATVVAPAVRGALFPVYEVFAEDAYRLQTLIAGLPDDARVIDVGAHVGSFSIAVATALPKAEIWAYEASPSTARYLAATVAASGLEERIHANGEALAATAGSVMLHDVGVGSPLSSTTIRVGAPTVSVPAITVDEVFARVGAPVDLVKIDAEGIEYDLLLLSDPQHWATVSRIVLEYHEVPGHGPEQIIERLGEAGLELELQVPMVGNPREGMMWFARSTQREDG